jgi:LytS/YehU family sensor histidine kinase
VREQSYTFLPAGDYRFDVRARDADGQLSAVASLAFVVLPPWWLTRWALLVYVALGSGVVAGVVRLRMRALRQRARQLEDIVAERTVELAEKNLELVRLNQLELDEKISARLGEEKARLEVLRYQLNPHFLFNALATISGLAVREPAAARAVARQLAEFCRLTLTRGRHEFVTMDEEFQMLASYLDVVRAGREEVPEIALTLGPGAGVEKIPAFLLLPLVENAAKYGRGLAGGPLRLELSAQFEPGDGALAIEVANTGTWMDDFADHGDTPSTRIGLDNIRERLARTYPGAHAFTTEARDGWVRVRIRLTPVA